MTNYQSGARLERLARAQLERQGFTVVRSAGSKGPVDLVAWNHVTMRFIQVKALGAARKADIEKLQDLDCPVNASVELWERDSLSDSGWKIKEY
jgi:Holliday junction resolvase